MAGAAQYDVTMDQGTTYVLEGYVQKLTNPNAPYDPVTNPYIPFDFTSWTALSEIRESSGNPTALLTSTTSDRIQLNYPSTGWFTLSLAPTDTASWAFNNASPDQWNGVWDITMSYGTYTIKPYQGAWNINRLISR